MQLEDNVQTISIVYIWPTWHPWPSTNIYIHQTNIFLYRDSSPQPLVSLLGSLTTRLFSCQIVFFDSGWEDGPSFFSYIFHTTLLKSLIKTETQVITGTWGLRSDVTKITKHSGHPWCCWFSWATHPIK